MLHRLLIVCLNTSTSWCQQRVGLVFFFFTLLGKWVSNLVQASYLGWSNENHQYLDVMLETFCPWMVFIVMLVYILIFKCMMQRVNKCHSQLSGWNSVDNRQFVSRLFKVSGVSSFLNSHVIIIWVNLWGRIE